MALLAVAAPATAEAQPPSVRRDEQPPHRDLRVVIESSRSGPRFLEGPKREEFVFVRGVPAGRLIDRRETLLELLLRPAVSSLAWGLGEVSTAELAALLGLPLRTTLYAVQPQVAVVSAVPPGYFVAEALPQNVALVSVGPRGEPVVLVRRVPPGAVIAYQSSPGGVVLGECIVVPPVQQVVMVAEPVPVVYASQPASLFGPQLSGNASVSAPAAPPPAAPQVAVAPGKNGKIVYDADKKPIGVIVLDSDGKQEFVPLQ